MRMDQYIIPLVSDTDKYFLLQPAPLKFPSCWRALPNAKRRHRHHFRSGLKQPISNGTQNQHHGSENTQTTLSESTNYNISPKRPPDQLSMASAPSMALPGQLLGPATQYRPGPGVHLHEANLYSSLLGAVTITQPDSTTQAPAAAAASKAGPPKRLTKITAALHNNKTASSTTEQLPTISVHRQAVGRNKRQREVLPQVGNVVLCRVTRITPRQAVVAILVCGETVLEAEWQGVIRVQDVRATEKDRVKIYESFRPGDIVRASVVSAWAIATP